MFAAGRRGEDLSRYLCTACVHRVSADGRRERPENVAPNSRHRYDNSNSNSNCDRSSSESQTAWLSLQLKTDTKSGTGGKLYSIETRTYA